MVERKLRCHRSIDHADVAQKQNIGSALGLACYDFDAVNDPILSVVQGGSKFYPLRLEPRYHCRTAGGIDLVVRKRQADGAQKRPAECDGKTYDQTKPVPQSGLPS